MQKINSGLKGLIHKKTFQTVLRTLNLFFLKLCFKWLGKGPKVKEFLVCYRHPNTACEVLTADVYAIIDKLTNNEVLVLS